MEAFTQYYQIRSLVALCCLSMFTNILSFLSTSFTSPVPLDMMVRTFSILSILFSVHHRYVQVSTVITWLFLIGTVSFFYFAHFDAEANSLPPVVMHLSEFSIAPVLACYMIRGRGGYLITFLTIVLYVANVNASLGMILQINEDQKTGLLIHGIVIQLFPLWILFSFESEMKTYHTLLEKFLDLTEERSKEKTHFISRMSHELRTPLHGLLSSADLIKRTPMSQEQATYLSVIDSCGEAVMDVVTKIVDIIKIESGDLETVISNFSLIEVVKSVSQSLMSKADQKGLNFFVDFDLYANGFDVNGDKNHLREVLLNVRVVFVLFVFLFFVFSWESLLNFFLVSHTALGQCHQVHTPRLYYHQNQ
jgi:signal transduction histidine kinase